MDRTKYNTCMRPHIIGSKPKEQRKLDFCVGAKICSGKAKTKEEAELICKEAASLPKPARSSRRKRGTVQSCEREVREVAQCMVDKIDMNLASNINSIEVTLVNAMMECRCPPQK